MNINVRQTENILLYTESDGVIEQNGFNLPLSVFICLTCSCYNRKYGTAYG